MSDFAEFDPLVSPVTSSKSNSTSTTASSSSSSTSTVASASKVAPATKEHKFNGVNEEFLYHAKWHSLNSAPNQSCSLEFTRATGSVDHSEEDPVARIQREKEEKASKEAADRLERERAEKQRQDEAVAAAAAGKEELESVDAVQVKLPSPKMDAGHQSPSLLPVDENIMKQQAELQKVAEQHEKEERERLRYVGKKTLHFTRIETTPDLDLTKAKKFEYQGIFELNGTTIKVSQVTKTDSLGEEVTKRVEVPGVSYSKEGV